MLIAHAHAQGGSARADGECLIAQLPGQIEGLARRLLARQTQCVLLDLCLNAGTHRRCGTEEAIRRGEPFERLMRTLKVVVLDIERHPPLAVLEVRKYRAREQLFPQRLPEALDLAAGLRVVRTALHVRNAVALELGLELGAAAPSGVLAPLVGQDLARCAVLRNATRQSFQHQHASLVMRHRQTHQVTRVIIQERRHVQALMAAQQEREQIRLPQLVGLGALEVLHPPLALGTRRHRRRLHPGLAQHPSHRRRRSADPQEPAHHIAEATAARVRLCRVCRQDRPPCSGLLARARARRLRLALQRPSSALPIHLHPRDRGGVRHAQSPCRLLSAQSSLHH